MVSRGRPRSFPIEFLIKLSRDLVWLGMVTIQKGDSLSKSVSAVIRITIAVNKTLLAVLYKSHMLPLGPLAQGPRSLRGIERAADFLHCYSMIHNSHHSRRLYCSRSDEETLPPTRRRKENNAVKAKKHLLKKQKRSTAMFEKVLLKLSILLKWLSVDTIWSSSGCR